MQTWDCNFCTPDPKQAMKIGHRDIPIRQQVLSSRSFTFFCSSDKPSSKFRTPWSVNMKPKQGKQQLLLRGTKPSTVFRNHLQSTESVTSFAFPNSFLNHCNAQALRQGTRGTSFHLNSKLAASSIKGSREG